MKIMELTILLKLVLPPKKAFILAMFLCDICSYVFIAHYINFSTFAFILRWVVNIEDIQHLISDESRSTLDSD